LRALSASLLLLTHAVAFTVPATAQDAQPQAAPASPVPARPQSRQPAGEPNAQGKGSRRAAPPAAGRAQGAAGQATPGPQSPAAPPAQGASRSAEGAPSPAQGAAPPPLPQRTQIDRFENWTVTCNEFTGATKKRVCAAQLQVQQTGTNQILLAWTLFVNDAKQVVGELQTPTGVSIPAGVELQLEKSGKRKLPFESCETGHCSTSTVMDNEFVREITASETAQVVIRAVNGTPLQFTIPLKGFDKAYAQLKTAL